VFENEFVACIQGIGFNSWMILWSVYDMLQTIFFHLFLSLPTYKAINNEQTENSNMSAHILDEHFKITILLH